MLSLSVALFALSLVAGITHWLLVWMFGSTLTGEPMKIGYGSRAQMLTARIVTAFLGGFGLAGLATEIGAHGVRTSVVSGVCLGIVLALLAWISTGSARGMRDHGVH